MAKVYLATTGFYDNEVRVESCEAEEKKAVYKFIDYHLGYRSQIRKADMDRVMDFDKVFSLSKEKALSLLKQSYEGKLDKIEKEKIRFKSLIEQINDGKYKEENH